MEYTKTIREEVLYVYVLFKTRGELLYQHTKLQATDESFRSDKARTASVLNNFKTDQSYESEG